MGKCGQRAECQSSVQCLCLFKDVSVSMSVVDEWLSTLPVCHLFSSQRHDLCPKLCVSCDFINTASQLFSWCWVTKAGFHIWWPVNWKNPGWDSLVQGLWSGWTWCIPNHSWGSGSDQGQRNREWLSGNCLDYLPLFHRFLYFSLNPHKESSLEKGTWAQQSCSTCRRRRISPSQSVLKGCIHDWCVQ